MKIFKLKAALVAVTLLGAFYISHNAFAQQPTLRIPLSSGSSNNGSASAVIQNINSEFDQVYNDAVGLLIDVHFEVKGLKGVPSQCVAFFYWDSSKEALNDYDDSYRSGNGKIATSDNFTPNYDNTVFNSFKLFLPYEQLHLAEGVHELCYTVAIFDADGKQITTSNYIPFTLTQN